MIAVGADGCKAGWAAVAVDEEGVVAAGVYGSAAEVVEAFPEAAAFGFDMPIGLPEHGVRTTDAAARAFVGPRRASVFAAPPREVLELTYADAVARCAVLGAPGVSRQAYALGPKILELEPLAAAEPRVVEVHPECSFRELNGAPLEHPKTTWAGFRMRVRLLEAAGIAVPEWADLPILDTVDAAAAAWSARRVARGEAAFLPDGAQPGEPAIRV